MPAGNSNFDTLLSTTLANYRDQLTDNVFTARPLTYFLTDKGRIRMLVGGTKIVKAQLRIDELISRKRELERSQGNNLNEITNAQNKIVSHKDIIEKIKIEFEKEKIYKIYLELFGKNGISKIIMKTMMPLINQELQRLLQDSCYFNLNN